MVAMFFNCGQLEKAGSNALCQVFLLVLLLPLVLFSCAPAQVKDWAGVTISGKIIDDDSHPVRGVHVYAYQVGGTSTLGPADAMSEPTGEDGVYTLILPQGTYTLIARKRRSGSISGPLKNGDMSGKFSETLHAGSKDRSGLDITMKYFRQGLQEDPKRRLTTDTRITGTVVDPDGMVLSGISVFAYRGASRQDPPDYLGSTTDSEGRFEISLPGGGEYTIGARTGQGGRPGPDDSIGLWGEKDQPKVIVEGEIVEGVEIVVRPFGETK